jgi:hypothetical protein
MMMTTEDAGEEQTVAAHTEYFDILAYLARNNPRLFAVTDDGADTSVIGQGWRIMTDLTTAGYANLVGFDEKATRKSGLPIVTGITKVNTTHGKLILMRVNQAVWNKGSNTTLISEFQV